MISSASLASTCYELSRSVAVTVAGRTPISRSGGWECSVLFVHSTSRPCLGKLAIHFTKMCFVVPKNETFVGWKALLTFACFPPLPSWELPTFKEGMKEVLSSPTNNNIERCQTRPIYLFLNVDRSFIHRWKRFPR